MSNSSLLFKKFKKKTGKKSQKNSRLFLATTLSSIRIVIGTKNVIVLRWYTIFFFTKWGKGSMNFIRLLRVVFSSQHRRYWGSTYQNISPSISLPHLFIFHKPASANQIWKMLSIIPSLTVTILCHWRHFEDVIQEKWRDSQAGWV